jgi:intraflagellar transport protein 80
MLIVQSPFHFALVDSTGIHIYSYEGRHFSTIKYSGLRMEFLNEHTISLSRDALALIDPASPRVIRVFDTNSGRPMGGVPAEHKLEVLAIALNQQGSGADRKIAFLDKNKDLYLCPVHKQNFQKLGSMVDSFLWNDVTDMLVTLTDQKLCCFLYPAVAFVDKDLLPSTTQVKPCGDAGKYAQIVAFNSSHVAIRKADGALLAMAVSPYPALLYQQYDKGLWDQAIRLCRYVKVPELWACLAAMATHARELNTVEIALAAIEEVDKVKFIAHINRLPDDVLKNAELALFSKRPDEALGILIQNKRIYRAIKMLIRLHRWTEALDLAIQHKTHVDTVLAYRQRHLEQMNHIENNDKFNRYSQEVPWDWETVKAKVKMEKENERQAAGGGQPFN